LACSARATSCLRSLGSPSAASPPRYTLRTTEHAWVAPRPELATRPRTEIAAGETVVEKHVFDLPRDARGVVLEVSFGKIGDTLDWLFLGKRTYALPAH